MTTTFRHATRPRHRQEQLLERQVLALVKMLHPAVSCERRQYDRLDIPGLFRLTPLDPLHGVPSAEPLVVVGKNLCQRGLAFFHDRPISCRRARIELDQPELGEWAAEVDLQWCRFAKLGWYESGGRLIRVLDLDAPAKAG